MALIVPSTSSSSALPLSWLFLLGALIAIGPLTTDMYLPAFPAMGRDMAAEPGTVAGADRIVGGGGVAPMGFSIPNHKRSVAGMGEAL